MQIEVLEFMRVKVRLVCRRLVDLLEILVDGPFGVIIKGGIMLKKTCNLDPVVQVDLGHLWAAEAHIDLGGTDTKCSNRAVKAKGPVSKDANPLSRHPSSSFQACSPCKALYHQRLERGGMPPSMPTSVLGVRRVSILAKFSQTPSLPAGL